MKKDQTTNIVTFIFIGLVIILVVAFYIIYNKPSVSGNVINPPSNNNINSDAQNMNQAFDYFRDCLLNCPRECPSCGVLSLKCVKSCQDFSNKKQETVSPISKENYQNLLSDKNSKWMSCMVACINSYDDGDYIDYNCIRGC